MQQSWHWQYRLRDTFNGTTLWASFGANGESEADFIVIPNGSNGPHSCAGSAPIGGSARGIIVLVCLLFFTQIR